MKKKINSLSLKKNVISKLGSNSINGGGSIIVILSNRGCTDNGTRNCGGPTTTLDEDRHTNKSCDSIHVHCF